MSDQNINNPEELKAREEILKSLAKVTGKSSAELAKVLEEVQDGLAEILEEVAGVNPEDVAVRKSFTDDLDVDSLSMVEVVVAAEEKFGVKIPDDEVQNLKTVGDAVTFIVKAQQAPKAQAQA